MLFTSGRTAYHFHTRTKTGRTPALDAGAPSVWVEQSPADAAALGIGEGDRVRVESPRGALVAAARLTGLRRGVVFAPFHYGSCDDNGARSAANETMTSWDPVSKQPSVKLAAVRVSKVTDGGGTPAPAPTTTASAPVAEQRQPS